MEEDIPVDGILSDLKQAISEMTSGMDIATHLLSFIHSIDWKEPWIMSLLFVEVFLFALVFYFRRSMRLQAALFVLLAMCIYKAEVLNAYCAEHWRYFSKQSYFDKNGIFWSALISGPLLVLLLCILVNYLLEMMRLMVEVKKKQLVAEAQKREQRKKES